MTKLTPNDERVLATIVGVFRENPGARSVSSGHIANLTSTQGMEPDACEESIWALASQRQISARRTTSGWQIEPFSDYQWLEFERRAGVDLTRARRELLRQLVEDERRTWHIHASDESLPAHPLTVKALLHAMKSDGVIEGLVNGLSGLRVSRVTPLATRELRNG